ncbi:hypothetical protein AVEN_254383-1 [Araneus ventricosus]|uniref:Uncharacterized protein n=1 Tax=Araneus ventricosus TaxID=182803 RepID=A0A4Y2H8H0_ARAVE|nr:hypothetical protein AVEN_254383-1 [Araneus ventricosus]
MGNSWNRAPRNVFSMSDCLFENHLNYVKIQVSLFNSNAEEEWRGGVVRARERKSTRTSRAETAKGEWESAKRESSPSFVDEYRGMRMSETVTS